MSLKYDSNDSLLSITLSAAVPLRTAEIRQQIHEGRLSDREMVIRAKAAADMIACHGDNIMYRGHKKGDTAKAFNALADGLAMLAFCPGGVKFMGQKWEANRMMSGAVEASDGFETLKDLLEAVDNMGIG